jgi:hypothetical protein
MKNRNRNYPPQSVNTVPVPPYSFYFSRLAPSRQIRSRNHVVSQEQDHDDERRFSLLLSIPHSFSILILTVFSIVKRKNRVVISRHPCYQITVNITQVKTQIQVLVSVIQMCY